MKFSNLLILGGVGVVIYLILKNNQKGRGKTNNTNIKNLSLSKDMKPYLFEKTTMRPELFQGDLVSSFNTNQYATIAPSTLQYIKIKENDL
jgi:hypothetical protein